jgi:hypothetical protein
MLSDAYCMAAPSVAGIHPAVAANCYAKEAPSFLQRQERISLTPKEPPFEW